MKPSTLLALVVAALLSTLGVKQASATVTTPTGVTASHGTYPDKIRISWTPYNGPHPENGYIIKHGGTKVGQVADDAGHFDHAVPSKIKNYLHAYRVVRKGFSNNNFSESGNTSFDGVLELSCGDCFPSG